jgi:hypothetical protein
VKGEYNLGRDSLLPVNNDQHHYKTVEEVDRYEEVQAKRGAG